MAKMSYFPHDVNARHDPKIRAITRKWGGIAYSWYFQILEQVYGDGGAVDLNDDIMKEVRADDIIGIEDTAQLVSFIDDCVSIGLFDGGFWKCGKVLSNRCAAELEDFDGKQEKRRAAGVASGRARRARRGSAEVAEQDAGAGLNTV